MRVRGVIVVAALAIGTLGGAAAAGPAPIFYLVRPDARLCPSPLCGGAWARRVNHPATRCADGSYARECYVASAPLVPDELWSSLAGTTLVRGRLVPADVAGFPDLGRLDVMASWRPAGPSRPGGTTFRVVDTGIRCVTSPCFSLRAEALERPSRRLISDLDLTGVGASSADERRAARAVAGEGLLVTGVARRVPDAGPAGAGATLRATQFWLRP